MISRYPTGYTVNDGWRRNAVRGESSALAYLGRPCICGYRENQAGMNTDTYRNTNKRNVFLSGT